MSSEPQHYLEEEDLHIVDLNDEVNETGEANTSRIDVPDDDVRQETNPEDSSSIIVDVVALDDITDQFRTEVNAEMITNLFPSKANRSTHRQGSSATCSSLRRTFASSFHNIVTQREGDYVAADCQICKRKLKVRFGPAWESRMKTSVKSHVRKHTSIIPFNCVICNYSCNYHPEPDTRMRQREVLKEKIEPTEPATPNNTPDSTTSTTQETEKCELDHDADAEKCDQCVELKAELAKQKRLVVNQTEEIAEMQKAVDAGLMKLNLHKGIINLCKPDTTQIEFLKYQLKELDEKVKRAEEKVLRAEEYAHDIEDELNQLKKWQENVFKEKEDELKAGRIEKSSRRESDTSIQQDRPISQNSDYPYPPNQSYNTGNRYYRDKNRDEYRNRNTGPDHRNDNFKGSEYPGRQTSGDNRSFQRNRPDSYRDGIGHYENDDRSETRPNFDSRIDIRGSVQEDRSNNDYPQRERYPSENRPQTQQGYNNQGYNRNYNHTNRPDFNQNRNNGGNTDDQRGYSTQKGTYHNNQNNRSSCDNKDGNIGGYHGSYGYNQKGYSDSNYQYRNRARYNSDDRAENSQSYNRHDNNYNQRDGQGSNYQDCNVGRRSFDNRSDGRQGYSNNRESHSYNQQNRAGNSSSYYNKNSDMSQSRNNDRSGYNSDGNRNQNSRNSYNTGSLQRPKSPYQNKGYGHRQGHQNWNSTGFNKSPKKDVLEKKIDADLANDEERPIQKSEPITDFGKPGFGEDSDNEENAVETQSFGGLAQSSKKNDDGW